ncbi:MAG: Slp family lipoprotein [Xanthomonadaceae bacterium]|nr:Slp family lipoprotein [Xanthomonadaceae bacterium]
MDPEIFVNGREVTVVGRLESFNTGNVGQFAYRYPVLDAESIHLWPERVESSYYGRGHYGSSDPYWPYYSPFYNRYYPPFFYPYSRSRSGFFHGSIHSSRSTRSTRSSNSLSGAKR